jgi:DNA-binding transcriptional ArsR family regulator
MQLQSSTDLTNVLKALADPTRRALFERLSRGEATVGELTSFAGVSQPAVSQHLGALARAGLVAARKTGRNAHYRAEPKKLAPLIDWVSRQDAFWRDRLGRMEDLLKELK